MLNQSTELHKAGVNTNIVAHMRSTTDVFIEVLCTCDTFSQIILLGASFNMYSMV